MSTNDLPFIERSIDNSLIAPFVDRAIGVRAETSGKRWFAAAGLFGEPADPSGDGDEGWGTSGRFIYAPTIESDRALHFGVGAAYREPSDDSAVRIRDETTHFSNLRIVDTGLLTNTRSVTLLGLEAAYAHGPWWVSGEYNDTSLDRRGAPDLGFDGWHVAATYTLGGESRARAYRIGSGEFKRLQPARNLDLRTEGRGTWELAARYASIDLNDGTTVGGSEKALTVGANWYVNSNIRTLLSWTRILDTDASTPLRAGADGLDIFAARMQFAL
jgi:phosphate-selective porin OprO/OprP